MRNLFVRAVVAAFLLLGASAFVIDWQQLVVSPGHQRTLDAMLDGDPTQMRAQVPGYLVDVPVRDDSVVHRGDLLFAIDGRDYQARVDRAAAEVVQAAANVDVAEAQLAQQGAQIGVAQAHIVAAEAARVHAAEERARQAGLLHTESYLARDWQGAVAADQGAAAAVEGQRRALTGARTQIDVLTAQVESQRAALEGKRAALALAQVQLGYTRILAPFDGVGAPRLARFGDYVAAGTTLITLVPLQGAWVVGNFREQQLVHMATGQPARITVDALPGVVFRGRVDSIGATSQADGSAFPPDRAVGNFTKIVQRVPVKIVLDPAPDFATRLRPGLSVEAEVDTAAAGR